MFRRKHVSDSESDDEMIPPEIKQDRRISISAESMDPEEEGEFTKVLLL